MPLTAPRPGSRRRDAPAAAPAPAPTRRTRALARGGPGSAAAPAPPRPARLGSAEPAAGSGPPRGRGGRPGRDLGKRRAAGALGGPGAKMASRGLGAEPSRPRRPAGPQSPPPAVQPPPLPSSGSGDGEGEWRDPEERHRPPRQLPGPRPGASALGARRACRDPGCAVHRRPCTSTAGVSGFLGPCRFPCKERCERTNHL